MLISIHDHRPDAIKGEKDPANSHLNTLFLSENTIGNMSDYVDSVCPSRPPKRKSSAQPKTMERQPAKRRTDMMVLSVSRDRY